jgi:predicted metalloprotease with PDZ domain
VDGTYLAIDRRHAHINMPAAFIFDLDRQDRPIRVTFVRPDGLDWRVATQLYATSDPLTFTAPNLQYFMDSPVEFSSFLTSTFTIADSRGASYPPATFRVVVHARGAQPEVDDLARLVERLVREERAVYGEFPRFEPGTYTFLLDYLSDDDGDGMEHRNSTVITSGDAGAIASPEARVRAMNTISHEFFHAWNIERIRPAGLEPFDFTRANITCCLWLGEGFTQYYGTLLLM